MKTVHLITGLATGGAEKTLYNLLQGGLSTEFDCHVISLSDAGTIDPSIANLGVPVITLGMRPGRPKPTALFKLRKIIKKLCPDLIQGWMYHGNLAATLAHSSPGEKVGLVWNIRHSLYRIGDEKLLTRQVIRANRFFSDCPGALLYNSLLARKQHEDFGFTTTRGLVIPNGINLQEFSFSEEARQRVRHELGIPPGSLVVGHVARFHPMKDHINFLQAAEIIGLRYHDVHFILCGRDVCLDNISLKQNIPVFLQNRFHLLGERGDIADLLSAMDILVNSSWTEAFPNVLGEAMAIGVPCVATDVGDSATIVGDCGVVVNPRDKSALAKGIESLLTLPANERYILGERAHRRIKDKFTLTEITKRYIKLYKTIIQEKRKGSL